MSDPAAFQATYCNFKNIGGRKVVQLIFEIPVEQAGLAYDALGWPDAVDPVWVAIAKLDPKKVQP